MMGEREPIKRLLIVVRCLHQWNVRMTEGHYELWSTADTIHQWEVAPNYPEISLEQFADDLETLHQLGAVMKKVYTSSPDDPKWAHTGIGAPDDDDE